jgi:hypothetical protein
MGNVIISPWKRRRKKRVYLSGDDEENSVDVDLPNLPGHANEFQNFQETAERVTFTKENIPKQLDLVTKQSQQAIIDATIISTRKNTYGNAQAMTDMYPNSYILKSMTSRSTKSLQEQFVKKNQAEILSNVAILQTIQGYRTNEFIDDQVILHEHEAYFSSINYYLTNQDHENS